MANKKISQLVGIGTSSTVSGTFLLPVASGPHGGQYNTVKTTALELARYIFTGDSAGGGYPAPALSGQSNVYFNNPSWQDTTAAANGVDYAYLMVKSDNGLLTTGSGIGKPVGGDNLGNHTATQTLNLQDNIIENIGSLVDFQDGGNIGSSTSQISLEHPTKIQFDAPTIQLGNSYDSITVDGSFNVDGDTVANSANFEGTITGESLEITNLFSATSANFEGTITGNALEVEGPASMKVNSLSNTNIDCSVANFHYKTITADTKPFNLTNVTPGQTITVAVRNSNAVTNSVQTSFQSGNGSNKVQWDETNFNLYNATSGCPGVTGSRSNVYTFISIGDQLFGSAVTGLRTP